VLLEALRRPSTHAWTGAGRAETFEGSRCGSRSESGVAASDLACYCTNLADDLQKWLVPGSIDAGVLGQVRDELREIAIALDIGAPISPMPEIPLPPQPRRRGLSRQRDREPTFDDDEIPF
jgi:hypothetical protein